MNASSRRTIPYGVRHTRFVNMAAHKPALSTTGSLRICRLCFPGHRWHTTEPRNGAGV